VLPLASVAVQTTVVVPTEYGPELLTVIDETEQLSVAVAVPIEVVEVHEPASVLIVAVAGQVMIGD